MGSGFSDLFEYDRGRAFPEILGLKLVARVVLVLSIAVLVLVVDLIRQAIS